MTDDPSKPKQELSFFEQIGGDMAPISDEDRKSIQEFQKQGMKEEAKGLPILSPRVDILHAGAVAFKFREAAEEDQIKKSFSGILIHVDPQRAWWEKGLEEAGGGQMPDCFSRNLVAPDKDCGKPQSDTCASCQYNAFGSDAKGGRGKGCKEMRRLFFLPEGKMDAHVMTVPPSSLKALKSYFTFLAEHKVSRPQMVITKFSVKQAENKDGTEYSELQLTMVKPITDERLQLFVMEVKRSIESMMTTAAPLSREDAGGTGH